MAASGRWTGSPPGTCAHGCRPGSARWPATANPHLLINQSTGGGTRPVRRSYIQATVRKVEITAQELRADRLLG